MSRKDATPEELLQLTEVFRKAGAPNPERWAGSQLREGIPQLAIFCFTKALWGGVVDENDESWIDQLIQLGKKHPKRAYAQAGPALEEMLANGVSRQAIVDLVRVMQCDALFYACTVIDGARVLDLPVDRWQLHQVDEQGTRIAQIEATHEVLLDLDPTGRRMHPRNWKPRAAQ